MSKHQAIRRSVATVCWVLTGLACGSAETKPSEPAQAAPEAPPVPPEPAPTETLALHMSDHVGIATQARDAIIRGQLVEATGPLTWLAQHKEPHPQLAADPFLGRVRHEAQRAIDGADLRASAVAVGSLAAACGDCHRAAGKGPKLEPAGLEDLEDELTLQSHMHGYLWATDTLWNALIADAALWETGVRALAELTPPKEPSKLAGGFSAIAAWAEQDGKAASSTERGAAYGRLIAQCGACHAASAVVPGR